MEKFWRVLCPAFSPEPMSPSEPSSNFSRADKKQLPVGAVVFSQSAVRTSQRPRFLDFNGLWHV